MKLGIYCSGSLGQEVYNLIRIGQIDNIWDDIFFIDDINQKEFQNDIKILTYQNMIDSNPPDAIEIIIATGEPYYREKLYTKVKRDGYNLATLISKSVLYGSGTVLEKGCIIFPFCYIGNNVHINQNSILHTGAKVESECFIGDNSFISSGAFIGAETTIGKQVFVGPNASLKDNIIVEDNSVIGIGAVVVSRISKCSVYVGNPAHFLRENENHKVFSSSVVAD